MPSKNIKTLLVLSVATILLNLLPPGSISFAEVPLGGKGASILSVEEFKKLGPTSGMYSLSAFVTAVLNCPPCPADALCEPCRDMIKVSDRADKLTGDLALYPPKASEFKLGRKYIFKIKIHGAPLIEEQQELD